MDPKDSAQAEIFGNRLAKRAKHLRKWARLRGLGSYRLFDNDIPEIPLAVDLYEGHLVLSLYERPYEKDDALEDAWLSLMADTASERMGIDRAKVFLKRRSRQRGSAQYEALGSRGYEIAVKEDGLSFILNLSDYLDTGLFLDHRLTRRMVRLMAPGKRVLNLFSYTGSFSVYAAAGGAEAVVAVDISNTYQDWAERNLAANGIAKGKVDCRREDVLKGLAAMRASGERFGLIVLDPPTFSNSKRMERDFDVNRDHPALVRDCLSLLSPGGILVFSTNSRRLKFDPGAYPGVAVADITEESLDEDFRDRKIHRAWRLELPRDLSGG
jgi:23S rRNA (guanine2445-N2)-methyltransferase / 23S rRNA (guanine2069-N7)-methyltransferase